MRRIVIIAASMAGVSCATRLKRRLPESEINVILPPSLEGLQSLPASPGPALRRIAQGLPNLELLASREVGLLHAQDLMPGLDTREVTCTSERGRLTIRYEELVVEIPATVRLPRALQKAGNVFGWPMSGFAADPSACDAALRKAARETSPVLVVGSGLPALDAVFLAREAGAPVQWLCTAEKETPGIEPHLLRVLLRRLGLAVKRTVLPETTADKLALTVSPDGDVLEAVLLPDGTRLNVSCCLWTTPLMARHPLLREDGFVLDRYGRMEAAESVEPGLGVYLTGSGAALPAAVLPLPAGLGGAGTSVPLYAGGEEAAAISAAALVEKLSGPSRPDYPRSPAPALLGVRRTALPEEGLTLCRAGFTLAEAQAHGLEAEHIILARSCPAHSRGECGRERPLPEGGGENALLLTLIAHKRHRTLLGVQVLGTGAPESAAEGLFTAALAALAEGTSLEALVLREACGLPGTMLARGAAMLRNKLAGAVMGISPDELLDSAAAGAEFFILDLRAKPEWERRRIPEAYNIPLPQLKKRLQDEVPRYTPLVLVSSDGDDAYAAACRLAGLGATDLYVLDGGMDLWPYEDAGE